MDASGGRIGLGVSPSPSELFRECALPFEPCVGDFLSACGEPGLAVLPSLLSLPLLLPWSSSAAALQ